MGKSPLLAILLLSITVISAIPMIPVVFNGDVTYSGNPSMNLQGYDINVSMPGRTEWNVGTVGAGNNYEVDVDPAGAIGTISFYVGGVQAVETGTYEKGAFKLLDLTINSPPTQDTTPPDPYCGDGTCNGGETCSSCSTDCGSCNNDDDDDDDNDGGGGGGGSSGGSSSDTVIILTNDDSTSSSSARVSTTPITGGVVGTKTRDGFMDFLLSGGMVVIFAGLIIILGLILLLMPKR